MGLLYIYLIIGDYCDIFVIIIIITTIIFNFSTNITSYLIPFLTTNAVIYLTIKTPITNFPLQVKFLKNGACGRWKEKDTNEAKKKKQ